MSELKIHDNGVPLLSANDIEKKAEEVIEFFQPEILYAPCETPLLSFVDETSNKFDFTYDLSSDLGNNSHNHKILGKFCFKPRAIFIDKSVDGDLRQKFILAHEFGHLVLHRNILVKRDEYVNADIEDVDWDFQPARKF